MSMYGLIIEPMYGPKIETMYDPHVILKKSILLFYYSKRQHMSGMRIIA